MKLLEGGSYFLKDVETLVPRIFLDEDLPATERDAKLFAESLVLRVALAQDLFSAQTALAYRRALLSLQRINARSICRDWKGIYQCLTSEEFLYCGEWQIFKQSARTYPKWMVAPLLHHLGEESVECDFARALQWVKFDAKLSFRDTPNVDETREYLDDEFIMKYYDDNNDLSLLYEMNRVIKDWLATNPLKDYVPFQGCHSSGTVCGLTRRNSNPITKTKAFVMTPECQRYIDYRTGWDVNPLQLLRSTESGDLELVEMDIPTVSHSPINVIFVPKTPLTRRVVSPEDSLHMYLQADSASIVTPWMNKFHWCNLEDQQLSRDMAMKGSRDGSYATVDAKKASDLVRHSQLEIILEETPLWPLYNYSRSRTASVTDCFGDTVEITLRKAAPMGSRMCFLMETLVFALCCEIAVRRTLGRRSVEGDFRVYGDDTVIRSDCYPALRLVMSLLFFKINDDKSFYQKGKLIFREACGLYAINGMDVTPCQYSRKYHTLLNLIDPSDDRYYTDQHGIPFRVPSAAPALSLIDFCNRLMIKGLVNSRRCVLSTLKGVEWLKHIWRLPYSSYLEDEERIKQKKKTMYDTPSPTLLTFDHVDANFSIRGREKYWKGKRTGVMQYDRLTVVTRPRDVRRGSLAYFHWSSERSRTDVRGRNEREYSPVERLTYSSPGTVVWRYKR